MRSRRMLRCSPHLAAAVAVLLLSACSAPAPSAQPPTITTVGLVQDARFSATSVRYTFADGRTLEVDPTGYRDAGPQDWSGALVILGYDAEGQFVASFLPQGGLPDDCYVENEVGTEWGDYIEIRGVLWSKAQSFTSDTVPRHGEDYPAGTRFCFNADGRIASIVAR